MGPATQGSASHDGYSSHSTFINRPPKQPDHQQRKGWLGMMAELQALGR